MGYSKDLSFIHDAGFGNFARNAAPVIYRNIPKNPSHQLITDLGCGSGIMAQFFIEKGFQVYGLDISSEMIRIAKKNAPKATLKVGSFLKEPIPESIVITAVGEIFNYLFDPKVSLKNLQKLFKKCFDSLVDGGILVFDIMERSPKMNRSARSYYCDSDWAVLNKSTENKKTHQLTREITSFVRYGKTFRRTDEVHRLSLYDRKDLLKLLRGTGFEVNISTSYGKMPLTNGRAVYVCKKN